MNKTLNIRINEDREVALSQGFNWALTLPRGENIGQIVSKHRTYEAAEKAAKGREFQISDLSYQR